MEVILESRILCYWQELQRSLFPEVDNQLFPQTEKHGRVMVTLDLVDPAKLLSPKASVGRPQACRVALASAFIAKAVLNLNTTEALIDRLHCDKILRRLCGFEPWKRLPSKATFSNAFREFAQSALAAKLHEALIAAAYENRIVAHVSRDSTDIAVREKVAAEPKAKWKRIKGKKKRVRRQLSMTLEQMKDDLPTAADLGRKGPHRWKGYKLHLDCADGGIPLSTLVTSASLHDSQAAICLEEETSQRVVSFYSLMDKAYDAAEIRAFIARKDKVALIAPQKRQGKVLWLDPAQKIRLRERNAVERVFSRLKDHFGARHVRVRGHSKVSAHLAFCVLALTAEQLVRHFY